MQLQIMEFTVVIIINNWNCVNFKIWNCVKFGDFTRNEGTNFMDFATNLKRICQEKNTTPTKLCVDLGLSTNKVSLWNKGGLPKPAVLVKLAEKLECRVMDFFVDEDDVLSHNTVDLTVEFALDEDEKDIIRLFRMLDRKQKHEFMTKAYAYEEAMLKE